MTEFVYFLATYIPPSASQALIEQCFQDWPNSFIVQLVQFSSLILYSNKWMLLRLQE